jgi:hypothetical protein
MRRGLLTVHVRLQNRKVVLARRLGRPCVLRELNVGSRPEFEARLRSLAALHVRPTIDPGIAESDSGARHSTPH